MNRRVLIAALAAFSIAATVTTRGEPKGQQAASGDRLTAEVLKGWWTDAGTFESLYRATQLVVEGGANKL